MMDTDDSLTKLTGNVMPEGRRGFGEVEVVKKRKYNKRKPGEDDESSKKRQKTDSGEEGKTPPSNTPEKGMSPRGFNEIVKSPSEKSLGDAEKEPGPVKPGPDPLRVYPDVTSNSANEGGGESLESVLARANVLAPEDKELITAFFTSGSQDRDLARYKLNVEELREEGNEGGRWKITDYLEVDWRNGSFRRLRKKKGLAS